MRSSARGIRFHVRPLLLGLAVAVAQGRGGSSRLPLRLIPTADVHANAGVLSRIDALAGATCVASPASSANHPGELGRAYKDLIPFIDREQARLLLTHESPVVRAVMGRHLALTWPEDAALVYPLLYDHTIVPVA